MIFLNGFFLDLASFLGFFNHASIVCDHLCRDSGRVVLGKLVIVLIAKATLAVAILLDFLAMDRA